MPAGITETDGMMYVGATPWHRLGVRLDGPATAAEAIEAAGLDWTVETQPVYARHSHDGFREIDGKVSIVRTDTEETLGVMGNRYRPVQNAESFRFFDSVIAQGEAIYHTAGSLFGGKRIWILAKLPEDINVGPGDTVETYILLSNSHDGSSALRMMNTPIRVVCGNTLSVALGERGGFYARHTGNVMQKVLNARHSIGLAHAYYEMFARTVDQLVNTRMTEWEEERYLKKVFGFKLDVLYKDQAPSRKKAFESTVDLLSHPTNTVGGMQGTSWAAFNAVSYYIDHEQPVRGQKSNGLYRIDDRQLDRTWFGSGAKLRQRAYSLLAPLL